MQLRPYQRAAAEAVQREWQSVKSTLVVMPTGCHAPLQPILMFTGEVRRAQDVRVGDWLMGMDSRPRRVLRLHRGESPMYRVIPVKGEPFDVTEDHLLTLVCTNDSANPKFPSENRGGELVDVTVREWLTWPKWRKHVHKLLRVGVEFTQLHPPWWEAWHPDPYLIGALLGDGSFRANLSFTTADDEAIQAVADGLYRCGLTVVPAQSNSGKATCWLLRDVRRGKRGVAAFRQYLRALGLDGKRAEDKHIPDDYKLGTREMRLDLLAGLMDTDGSLTLGGYDYISKSLTLARDVAFVARSLGLAAYVTACEKQAQTGPRRTYYRVSISGDCSVIPLRVTRKRATPRKQKKDVLRTGFQVVRLGVSQYCGFTVDGDQRYLLGDFTVTHNCGKTILFADIIRRVFPRRALVLAHREELIWQAADKIKRVTGLTVGIEMADYKVIEDGAWFGKPHVVVSTIQTQTAGGDGGGRMGKFDPREFGLVVVDEAHHGAAASYRRVLDYYGQNERVRILGVTATPDRADEAALGQVYDTVAYDYEILDAIHDGWLVPITQRMITVQDLDYSTVRTTAGDLNGADLAKVLEEERHVQAMAAPCVEVAGDRRTLVFAQGVQQAERLAEIINRHRPGRAGFVCAQTPKDTRRRLLADFAAGKLQYVVNVGVLTEGFDDAGVALVVMCRPTKSRALYAQMIGRATRPLTGIVDGLETADERRAAIAASSKVACEVLDFVGNAGKHRLMTSADILGGRVSEEAVDAATRAAREAGKPVDMTELLAQKEREIEEGRRREAARRAQLVARAKYTMQTVDPFAVFGMRAEPARGWDTGKTLSERQTAILVKQGIDPNGLPYAQAKQLLNEVFRRWDQGLCSYKQARILAKHGYSKDLSREDAKAALDDLARNNWRRPVEVAG